MRLILHGHFYQPPRENPWTGHIEPERGASPFRNWNELIDHECYRANAFGRLMDDHNRIRQIVNNYELCSFDVGPTLLHWLAENDPQTLARMVEADRASAKRLGHGNAMAQGYNHSILPLDSARDRRTQIRWGLAAFRHYFERDADGMWLPETAANHEVLDALIDHGLKFAVLAPHQARRIRAMGEAPAGNRGWRSVDAETLDTGATYAVRHSDGSGRHLAVFFYDGPLARALGFGDALKDSEHFGHELIAGARRASMVHAAVDGETFGHHHAWGDRVLAHGLALRAPEAGFQCGNYAAQLEEHPPTLEVELELGEGGRGTSWSCAHGVERWRSDCGCRMNTARQPAQAWRAPLRAALELLRDEGVGFFERKGRGYLRDPWAARDAYIELILRPSLRRPWLNEHGCPGLARSEGDRALQFMEFQHQLLLMFTSCGWFFDEIGGIESRQVLRHAARALDLWSQLGGTPPVERFLEILRGASSDGSPDSNGATVFADIQRTDSGAADRQWAEEPVELDRERLRLPLERILSRSIEDAAWAEAEDLLMLAKRMKLDHGLFRAQEAFLAHAPSVAAEEVHRVGLELGFSAEFLTSREESK